MNTKQRRIEQLAQLARDGILTAELIVAMNSTGDEDIDLGKVNLTARDIDRLNKDTDRLAE